jgi:hypothetical protein
MIGFSHGFGKDSFLAEPAPVGEFAVARGLFLEKGNWWSKEAGKRKRRLTAG